MSDPTSDVVGSLTTAILLADPAVPDSLDVLSARFTAVDVSVFGPDADVAAEVMAGAVELIGQLRAGECADGQAVLDELGRAVADLSEMLAGEQPAGARTEAGAPAPAARADAATDSTPAPHAPAPGGASVPEMDDTALLLEFADSAAEYLDSVDAVLLGADDSGPGDVDTIFRAFHSIKGMAGFLGLDDIGEAAHEAESLLAAVRSSDEPRLDAARVDALFASVATLRELVAAAAARAGPPPRLSSGAPREEASPRASRRVSMKAAGDPRKGTVRVDERRLDLLLDTIGELVVAEASLDRLVGLEAPASEELAAQMVSLGRIGRQLQELATSLRMVAVRTTFRRMARLVRDLARADGKQVECELIGEDVEIDKQVVDGLGDALVHLVRNAVDHGVETPERRRARARPETARISLSARHESGRVVIDVADDGPGLDLDAIVEKARENGAIGPEDTPSADAAALLIFSPGLSTAGAVTDISGRGVGMDAVKRAVEDLRGTVGVTSTPGDGTTITLTLPLTLALIDGMVVRVGTERFIVPALSVLRTVTPTPGDVTTVFGTGEALGTREGIVPLVRLAELFSRGDAPQARDGDDVVLLVSAGSVIGGLVVDEVIGHQQIVIKPLGEALGEVDGVAGAAILPDGRVGLVLDVHALTRTAHSPHTNEEERPR